MKIAALADIHGNYQALITILDHVERWKPDLVIVLGDMINRGPRSRECLHLIQEKEMTNSWQLIQGNHEQYVLNFDDPAAPKTGPKYDTLKIIHWTYQTLAPEDIQAVKEMPVVVDIQLPNNQVLKAVHASLGGIRVGIYPRTSPEEIMDLINPRADLFLVGHTHQPLVRSVNETLVVNAGSIGLPFDGDTRAGYAQITLYNEKWQGEIIRIDYDLKAAIEDFYTSKFIPEGGPLAKLVLTELEIAWPQLSHWFKRYEESVLDHKISIEDAVMLYQENPNYE